MIHKARHDYIELSYVYGGAVAVLLFLSLIAMPIDTSRFGLLLPQQEPINNNVYAPSAFDTISIAAQSYVVYDLVDKKIIAAKNADTPLPMASITKLMMAITALANHDKNTKITINPESIEDGYDLGLKKGQVWSLSELLKYTLVFSSNDGAHAIADTLGGRKDFIAQMNTQSALLGLGLTFTDPAGEDVNGKIGGIGTALDVAKLFAVARKLYPEILDATTRTRVTTLASNGRISGIPNTNQDINNLFGAEVSKTGFTDSAGGNLGVIVDVTLGHPVAIVVLGSTREARFTDMEELYKALLKSVK
jgi:D-alanyl-D-alanine carboxypeptidase (penicillin-binding protein 5/6)